MSDAINVCACVRLTERLVVHGRQWVKRGDKVVMNVGKVGKLSSMSIRDTFEVCEGDDDDEVYRVQADLLGRTFEFRNKKGDLVAMMAKTKKALIQTAVFGSGSESTIDIAAGTYNLAFVLHEEVCI